MFVTYNINWSILTKWEASPKIFQILYEHSQDDNWRALDGRKIEVISQDSISYWKGKKQDLGKRGSICINKAKASQEDDNDSLSGRARF